jgi:anti-sigma B factor antagonist
MSFFYIGDDATGEGAEYGEDVVVLIAGGEIDFAASPQLKRRMADHIDAGARRLILDLSTVSFIDSTAIGVLVGAVMRLHELGGGSLAVVCTEDNERVMQIFEIAGIDSLITLHRTREEALSALTLAG